SNLGFDKEEEAREKQRKEAEAAAKREEQLRRSAPAYNPVDRSPPPENTIETVLNELNDIFEIIAAVPLMDEAEYGELRVHFEKGQGLDEIDERGFSIKEGTHLIWKGERDLSVLTKGVDADSALILQRILMHTLNIENKVRAMLANGGVDPDDDDEATEGSKAQ
ncbi:hypothetical protein BBJ28_00025275, partial [Nothophytophthora sp. Chile5]